MLQTDSVGLRFIGAAVAGPMLTILTLLLLRVEGGLIKAAAFAAGAMTVRLLQMILFGYVFATGDDAGGEAGPPISSPRRCCWWLVSSC